MAHVAHGRDDDMDLISYDNSFLTISYLSLLELHLLAVVVVCCLCILGRWLPTRCVFSSAMFCRNKPYFGILPIRHLLHMTARSWSCSFYRYHCSCLCRD